MRGRRRIGVGSRERGRSCNDSIKIERKEAKERGERARKRTKSENVEDKFGKLERESRY